MPQMAPLNWLSLYFLFTILFIFFMVTIYFMFTYMPKIKLIKKTNNNFNWKW